MASALAAVLCLRALAAPAREAIIGAVIGVLLCALALALDVTMPLKLYPVGVNATLLAVFTWSLWHPPPIIERIARLREPALPPAGVAHTRRVTRVWCGFFAINGLVALWTATAASDRTWAIWNGFISYVLIGLLLLGEWCVRRRLMASDVR